MLWFPPFEVECYAKSIAYINTLKHPEDMLIINI